LSSPLADLPSLSVRRPILVIVANLLIVIAGLAALMDVEVRELPNIDQPRITINAIYPGASPETVDTEVTSVIEGAISRISGVQNIESTSRENESRIRIDFYPSVDIDAAANDVREAVATAQRTLPANVEELTVIKADADSDPVMRLAVFSETLTEDALTRIVEDDIANQIAAVPGVATVELNGKRARVMRVIVDPLRLASYGLSVEDVAKTLTGARLDLPAGSFKSSDQLLLVRADASVIQPSEIERLEVRPGIRVGEVAHALYGPETAESYVRLDGRSVIGLSVLRQAKSNSIAIAEGVATLVDRLNASRDDIEILLTTDEARFVKGAMREVAVSLTMAVLIVVAVMYLFLGGVRPTMIPTLTIPVALIGTLVAVWMLGFSINILTLLALVLATGMIVDDAIVVLENIQRLRGLGIKPLAAAVLGTRQVFFAVIATTVTLISVFLPIAFLPGTAGRLFTEFGLVLAVSIAISGFVALTLCPMLASRLPENVGQRTGKLRAPVAVFGNRLAEFYMRTLDWALGARLIVLTVVCVIALAAGVVYMTITQELLPTEDRGVLIIAMQGPDGVGPDYMDRQTAKVEEILLPLKTQGEVSVIFSVIGRSGSNSAFVIAPLTPWDSRTRSQDTITKQINKSLGSIPGANARIRTTNSLGIRGGLGGLSFAITGTDYKEIATSAGTLIAAIEKDMPGVRDMRMSFQPTQPQLSIQIDRRKAEDLGVPIEGIANTLKAMVSGYDVAEINVEDRNIPIVMESATGAINDPGDLNNLFVSAGEERLVPLSAFITIEEQGIAAKLERVAQKRAVIIDADLTPGYTLDQAVKDLNDLYKRVLPPGAQIIYQGEAATLETTSRDVAITFAVAVLVVLLVLAAQFESFMSAVVVILTVPFGLAAAIFALKLTGTTINIYSQIGLVMLVGLMAKNGILVVEFADQLRDHGHPVMEAVRTASKIRLRPVTMTMLSTVLGGLPLVLGSGAGAEARAAIGWVIFGGLGLATVFTLYLVPVLYSLLAPLTKPRAHAEDRLSSELRDAKSSSAITPAAESKS